MGGGGIDRFWYRGQLESFQGSHDTIFDFQVGRDKLDLAAIDANNGLVNDQRFTYYDRPAESLPVHGLTYWYDPERDRTIVAANFDFDPTSEIYIELVGNIQFSSTDFYW